MPEHFDHNSYDPDRPAWEQRSVGGYTSSVPAEGGWMVIPTLLGWLNIVSGVIGLLSMSFGVVFVVLMVGVAGPILLPLIAGGAFVMVFSLFYLRLGQGLIRREEWSRWVTLFFCVLGVLAAPCSGISTSSQLDANQMSMLPASLQALMGALVVGGMVLGLTLNVFVIYALTRRDVSVHFKLM